jgi:hypothetical protein
MTPFKKIAVMVFGLAIGLSAASVGAQAGPPSGQGGNQPQPQAYTPEQVRQEVRQLIVNLDDPNYDYSKVPAQMRQIFVDFNSVSQGMDPTAAQQMRMDLFQQVMPAIQRNQAKIQKAMQDDFLKQLQQPLGATDDEFAALLPLLEKVADALRESSGGTARFRAMGGPNGNPQGMQNTQQNNQNLSPVDQATLDLQASLDDPNTNDDVIRTKLDTLRQAKAKAKEDLTVARNELRALLTVRQEGILVDRGLMD